MNIKKQAEIKKLLESSQDWRTEEDEKKKASSFMNDVCGVIEQHKGRLEEVREAVNMYESREYSSLLGVQLNGLGFSSYSDYNRSGTTADLKMNLIRGNVDTLVSKIGKNRILPRILSSGAQWHSQSKAKKADRWIRGMFRKLEVADKATKALLHCCLFGYGFIKVCADADGLDVVNVNPDEVFVEAGDSHYGTPSTMYHVTVINRTNLQSQFPDRAEEIEDVSSLPSNSFGRARSGRVEDSILVVEGWTLPSGCIKGEHIICCGDMVLFHEEWDNDYFPIVKMEYNPPVFGYYPRGLAHILASMQAEHDDVLNRMSDAQHLISKPLVFLRDGSTLTEDHISNEIGTILRVEDMNDFQVVTPVSIAGDTFNYADRILNYASQVSGVSQVAMSGKMPAGIDGASGRALREYNDMQTERFVTLAQSWERMHKKAGEIILKELRRCGADFMVKATGRNKPLETIKYSDLDLDIDDIVVQIFAVPDLPSTPAGKIQYVEELTQSGQLKPEEAMDLLEMTDVDAMIELKQAPRNLVRKIVERIVNDTGYDPFDDISEYVDLQYLREMALLYYNQVLLNEDENYEDVSDVLKQVIVTVDGMLESPEPAAPTEATALPPELGGMPAAPIVGAPMAAPAGQEAAMQQALAGLGM